MTTRGPRAAARPACRGHSLVIQLLIIALIVGAVALPIVLVSYSKVRHKHRLLDRLVGLVQETNDLKEKIKRAYDSVADASGRRLPHTARVLHDYATEFQALYRRFYDQRQRFQAGDRPPAVADLVALKRDFEAFRRRLAGHHARLQVLEDLSALGEKAVVLARYYQAGIRTVRDTAPYEPNRFLLPQLAEADRQLRTSMGWVLSGIARYPEDLKGRDTPVLIKTGIEQIRRVMADVDELFDALRGARQARVQNPNLGDMSLAEYLAGFRRERRKLQLPALPAGGGR